MAGDRVWRSLEAAGSGTECLLTLAALSPDELRAAVLSRLWAELATRLPERSFADWSSELRRFSDWSAPADHPEDRAEPG
jgi:hypothetical protein